MTPKVGENKTVTYTTQEGYRVDVSENQDGSKTSACIWTADGELIAKTKANDNDELQIRIASGKTLELTPEMIGTIGGEMDDESIYKISTMGGKEKGKVTFSGVKYAGKIAANGADVDAGDVETDVARVKGRRKQNITLEVDKITEQAQVRREGSTKIRRKIDLSNLAPKNIAASAKKNFAEKGFVEALDDTMSGMNPFEQVDKATKHRKASLIVNSAENGPHVVNHEDEGSTTDANQEKIRIGIAAAGTVAGALSWAGVGNPVDILGKLKGPEFNLKINKVIDTALGHEGTHPVAQAGGFSVITMGLIDAGASITSNNYNVNYKDGDKDAPPVKAEPVAPLQTEAVKPELQIEKNKFAPINERPAPEPEPEPLEVTSASDLLEKMNTSGFKAKKVVFVAGDYSKRKELNKQFVPETLTQDEIVSGSLSDFYNEYANEAAKLKNVKKPSMSKVYNAVYKTLDDAKIKNEGRNIRINDRIEIQVETLEGMFKEKNK